MRIDRTGNLLVVGGLLLAPLAAGCGNTDSTGNETRTADEAAFVKVVNVEVRTVAPSDFTSYVRLTGVVEAYEDVVVSSQESGVIERIIVDKGSRVRSGQAIAQINDEIVRAQVDEARASASLARERYERQRQLWEDEGIGSEIAFLQTKYDAQSADARLAFLEARLRRHTIASPIAGVLDERYVDVGEIVAPGTPVVRVLTVDRLKVVGGVPERFGPWVAEGAAAVLSFDVLPGQTLDGTIEYVGAAVDPRNRTFPIEIVLQNPGNLIKPRMVANVQVERERLTDVVVESAYDPTTFLLLRAVRRLQQLLHRPGATRGVGAYRFRPCPQPPLGVDGDEPNRAGDVDYFRSWATAGGQEGNIDSAVRRRFGEELVLAENALPAVVAVSGPVVVTGDKDAAHRGGFPRGALPEHVDLSHEPPHIFFIAARSSLGHAVLVDVISKESHSDLSGRKGQPRRLDVGLQGDQHGINRLFRLARVTEEKNDGRRGTGL